MTKDEQTELMQRMRSDGKTYAEIGGTFGVCVETVRLRCNPDVAERERERNRRRRRTPEYREWDRERDRRRYVTDTEFRERKLERSSKRFQAQSHPPMTYVIGSPDYPGRVNIGTTTRQPSRLEGRIR